MTTFDRYLLKRYLYVYLVLWVSMYGLFIVIDGFTNIDEFQKGNADLATMLRRMAFYYAYQSTIFFDLIASMMAVMAVTVTLALLLKQGELHPLLAAGISVYRLILPMMVGTAVITLLVLVNREYLIPRIAHLIQAPRSIDGRVEQPVEPIYDRVSRIHITGKNLLPKHQMLEDAEIILKAKDVADQLTTLRAKQAKYLRELKGSNAHPSGWLLKAPSPAFSDLRLTEHGKKVVHDIKGGDVFVVTDISFDQLSSRSRNASYSSTMELYRRIRNPAFGQASVRGQTLNLHMRLTQPFVNLCAALLAVPLILRKESYRLIVNVAICSLVLGAMYLIMQGGYYLGRANMIDVALAAWIPVITCGSLTVWMFGSAQT